MGYSLSVPCNSGRNRDKLAEFLRAHARPFSEAINGCPEAAEAGRLGRIPFPLSIDYDPTSFFHVGNELAYGARKNKVGFNFSTQSFFGGWMYTVLSWAALRVGARKQLTRTTADLGFTEAVPYITYDSEPQPVLSPTIQAKMTPEMVKWAHDFGWLVDDLGLCDKRGHVFLAPELNGAFQELARREIMRLDALWNS